jgi:Ner family transcriptional regulator
MHTSGLDWSSGRVKYMLGEMGTNMAKLARQHELAPSTLRNVFRIHWPKGEQIVACHLGKKPEQIWPSRYKNKNA